MNNVITSQTRLFGVIGYPIEHSLSPIMQQFFFNHFSINGAYFAFHVLPERLPDVITGLRAFGIQGLNVTTPFKESILAWVDEQAPEVQLLGAANTIRYDKEKDKVTAFSTDHLGFIESLGENKERFANSHAILFGAGGSAKAIAYALTKLSVQRVTVVNRTVQKAQGLAELMRTSFGLSQAEAIALADPKLNDIIADATIVINTTTLGMYPDAQSAIIRDFSIFSHKHFVYDLVYNPLVTSLLLRAQEMGATIQGGLDMLIFQGLMSLRIWQNQLFSLDSEALMKLRKILVGFRRGK